VGPSATGGLDFAEMTPFLDSKALRAHRLRNTLHSLLLVGGLGLVTGFCAWLIWGAMGVAATLVAVGLIYAFAPRMSPGLLMRLYRGRLVEKGQSGLYDQVLRVVDALADRAELVEPPRIYVIPSMTFNAFAAGTPDKAVIGITAGMIERLDLRELAGVLGHEISHIRNNDLLILGLADAMTRFAQVLAYLSVVLVLVNLPAFLLGDAEIPLYALALLYLAPTAGSLIQLALSRTREFDADLEAARLTGDPEGLVAALQKVERYFGRFWEDMLLPVPARRIPQPSLLRSHPRTEDRVARLRDIGEAQLLPRLAVTDESKADLVGSGRLAMRPRYRWTGVWF
jgi:heat shock protein HtpX